MFNPEEHIRYFTKEEYLAQTRDFFQNDKWMQRDGGEIRVTPDKGIYLFNPKYNTDPNIFVGYCIRPGLNVLSKDYPE